MKKTIVAIALVLTGLISKAQDLKVQTNVGLVSHFNNGKRMSDMKMVSFIGLELFDRVGLEYGYSYSLNTNQQELDNFILGNAQSWSAGQFNHLASIYYKTKRIDGNSANIGIGALISTDYRTDKTITKTSPYLKLGLDHQINQNWAAQVNGGFGNVFMFSIGITKTL